MTKYFILNADDFGLSKAVNRAVAEGYASGLLRSVSLAANGQFFDEAVNTILPRCPGLAVGIHLNITTGKSLCLDADKLVNEDSHFNNSFLKILYKTYNPKENDFLEQVEREFRRQIEKIMSVTKVTHIDSHSHIHSIPALFDMVCRLAKEYGIKEVRTHFENFYLVPEVFRHLKKAYLKNLGKVLIFNCFSIFNENTVLKYELKTNNYLMGILYGANMDSLSVSYGIQALKHNNSTVECLLHPCRYDEGTIDNFFDEYMVIRNPKLKHAVEKLGYQITNYSGLYEQEN